MKAFMLTLITLFAIHGAHANKLDEFRAKAHKFAEEHSEQIEKTNRFLGKGLTAPVCNRVLCGRPKTAPACVWIYEGRLDIIAKDHPNCFRAMSKNGAKVCESLGKRFKFSHDALKTFRTLCAEGLVQDGARALGHFVSKFMPR